MDLFERRVPQISRIWRSSIDSLCWALILEERFKVSYENANARDQLLRAYNPGFMNLVTIVQIYNMIFLDAKVQ